MRQTSLETFQNIKEEGTLSRMQQIVYDCIKQYPGLTDKQVSQIIGLPINCVTPRRGELSKMGMVAICGVRYTPTNRPAYVWKTT